MTWHSIQKTGEIVLSLPRSCILTAAMGRDTLFGQLLERNGKILRDEGYYIALVICEEMVRGVGTKNSEYIRAVINTLPPPENLIHLPIFWDDNELAELSGSPLLEIVLNRRVYMTANYELLAEVSPQFARTMEKNDFLW